MSIEQKLDKVKIKRALIVDDTSENLEAAKKYFNKMNISIDYASNAKQAKEMIQESQLSENKYDLIMTDLEMETKNAGIDVVKKALETLAYSTIVTGRNYDKPDSAAHGPNTLVFPGTLEDDTLNSGKSIKGKKNNSETWEFAFEKTLEHILSPNTQRIYNSAERYNKFLNKTPEIFVNYMLDMYKEK